MPAVRVGCALSDVNRADLPNGLAVPARLTDYARRFQNRVDKNLLFELQPEEFWVTPTAFPDQFTARETNRWWHTWKNDPRLAAVLKSTEACIGIHQPVQARDVLSSNFFQKYAAIEETKQAMLFANAVGANYFVFHLAMADRWEWDRRDQMDKALKIFKVFAAFYRASDFSFVPCIEILEYPKFPATGGETIALLAKCREILPETRLAFDISHLWGSRQRMLAAQVWYEEGGRGISFVDSLEYALNQTWEDIQVVHLGGCWESETHAVPGLHPQQDPIQYPIKLRESPSLYAEAGEIDLNRVLEFLLNYSVRRRRDLNLVLQIFNRDFDQVIETARIISADLNDRVMRAPEAEPSVRKAAKPKRTSRSAKTKPRPRQKR
jgi:hypothetical protein